MHVHIVARELNKENVITRLVHDLMTNTGWTASECPDPRADLNYFSLYLEWDRFRDFRATPTAALFSHYDAGRQGKEDIWKEAAQAVDLRLTWARMYLDLLKPYGVSAQVTPAIALDKFISAPAKKRRKPRVGVSGFVYPGGRKGEDLIARLAASPLGQEIELVASGRGWPIRTTRYDWEQLHTFYQSLDVFLNTSLIEGIPMPPLEAMACGVPVVVPHGVGLLDELPDVQNLFRYEAGDYEEMEMALRAAILEPVNVDSLRGVAARFSAQAWAETHQAAFEELIFQVPPVGTLPDWHGRAGVYIVAYGKPARECASRLLISLRDVMPGLPTCFVSDKPLGLETTFVEHPDSDVGARSVKTQIYDLAPAEWDYVLYLDADTEVVADISFLFQLLQDGWEFVICTNPAQYVLAREMKRPDNGEEMEETISLLGTDEILQYNGGVFAFRRNPRTAAFIRAWHTEWDRYGKRDQAALDRALYANPVRVYTLGADWNCVTRYDKPGPSRAILHYPMTARRWKGRIEGRLDRPEAWASVHPERKGHETNRDASRHFDGDHPGASGGDKGAQTSQGAGSGDQAGDSGLSGGGLVRAGQTVQRRRKSDSGNRDGLRLQRGGDGGGRAAGDDHHAESERE